MKERGQIPEAGEMRCWSHTVAQSFPSLPDPDKSVDDQIPKMKEHADNWPFSSKYYTARFKRTMYNMDLLNSFDSVSSESVHGGES